MSDTDDHDFIEYLDNFSKKKNATRTEFIDLIRNTNVQYIMGNMSSSNFACHDIIPVEAEQIPEEKSYHDWQKKHNVNVEPEIDDDDKELITIETNVDSISDLLNILEKYKYDELYKYNIDLKSLTNVKDELQEINNMIGMETLKQNILDQLLYFLQKLHTFSDGDYKHTVLCGPPGTGKTEVAKIMGKMYSKIGVLKNNVFKKVTRSDLIAGFLGQTAIKTKSVLDSCVGGVLFIDEVYSLGKNSDNVDNFSQECVDTICETLSDHKNDMMVIIAGYKNEIHERFFTMNTGLKSRFIWNFNIEKYEYNELFHIFKKIVIDGNWTMNDSIQAAWFKENYDYFENYGRDMEVLFTYSKISYSRRVYGSTSIITRIIDIQDIKKGLHTFIQNKNKEDTKERSNFLHSIYM
jgi:SpoVK/Ycf46/Vps4 family AAA+-type ATPase